MESGMDYEGQKLQAEPHASQAEDSWTSSLDCWSRWTSETSERDKKLTNKFNKSHCIDYKNITISCIENIEISQGISKCELCSAILAF